LNFIERNAGNLAAWLVPGYHTHAVFGCFDAQPFQVFLRSDSFVDLGTNAHGFVDEKRASQAFHRLFLMDGGVGDDLELIYKEERDYLSKKNIENSAHL
jgi:hypothetical protein